VAVTLRHAVVTSLDAENTFIFICKFPGEVVKIMVGSDMIPRCSNIGMSCMFVLLISPEAEFHKPIKTTSQFL